MADVNINLKVNTNRGSAEIKGVSDSIKELNVNVGKAGVSLDNIAEVFLGGLGAITAAEAIKTLTVAIAKLPFEAEKIKALNAQFETLSGSVGLSASALKNELVGASKGLVDDTDLIEAASKALVSLGSTASDIPKTMDLARRATAVFGGDVVSNFEAINQAVATGSTRALRQFGIIVDSDTAYRRYALSIGVASSQLSQAEKQQALLNAVLDQGNKSLAGVDTSILKNTNNLKELIVALKQTGETALLAFEQKAGPALDFFFKLAIERVKFYKQIITGITGTTEVQQEEESLRKLQSVARQRQQEQKAQEEQERRLIEISEKKLALGKQLAEQATSKSNAEDPQAEADRQIAAIEYALSQGAILKADAQIAEEVARAEADQREIDQLLAKNQVLRDINDTASIEEIDRNNARINAIIAADNLSVDKQKANKQKLKDFEDKLNEQRLTAVSSTFGNIVKLAQAAGKDGFEIAKAAGIAQATIDGVLAVQKALASAPPPFNFILAATVGAVAALNIAQIASAKPPGYKYGIDKVPGAGFQDSHAALLAPGERVVPRKTNEDLTAFLSENSRGGSDEVLADLIDVLIDRPLSVNIDGREVFLAVDNQIRSGRAFAS